jgi:hypothetical protein
MPLVPFDFSLSKLDAGSALLIVHAVDPLYGRWDRDYGEEVLALCGARGKGLDLDAHAACDPPDFDYVYLPDKLQQTSCDRCLRMLALRAQIKRVFGEIEHIETTLRFKIKR